MYYHNTLGGDPNLGLFGIKIKLNVGKAFRRFTKITKTSFQPKKIMGAIGSMTATVLTGGLGPIIAPKIISANSDAMRQLGMATTAIAAVAGAVVMGPSIAAVLGPKLASASSILGKGVEGFSTFLTAWNKLTPAKQQEASDLLTPAQIAAIEAGQQDLNGILNPPPPTMPLPAPMPPPAPRMEYQPDYDTGRPERAPAEAGMLGGLSPLAIGLMIVVPIAMQLIMQPAQPAKR